MSRGRFRLSENHRLAYEPIPNVEYTGRSLDFYNYRGVSNRLGYRGPEYQLAKPDRTYRIIVLGDSIAEGLGIDEYANVFPALVESMLRSLGRQVEVLNFAVSGYNTQQEVETLATKGRAFDPDLVILAYSLNDREPPYFHLLSPLLQDTRQVRAHAPPHGRFEKALHWSALYRFMRYRVGRAVMSDRDYSRYDTGDTVASSLAELSKAQQRDGFRTLVVVFPRLDAEGLQRYAFGGEHAYIRELAARNGLGLLDLLEPFRACALARPLARDELHPNAAGHRCAAEAIVATLERGQ